MTGQATQAIVAYQQEPQTPLRLLVCSCALWPRLCAALWVSLSGLAWAQDAVWLCGQTLTNRPSTDQGQDCRQVQLPHVTTVPGTRVGGGAPVRGAASSETGQERTASVRVGADEQRQRDAQARALLLAEKQRVQAVLQNARKGGDAAQVALTEADLASIERELARLP